MKHFFTLFVALFCTAFCYLNAQQFSCVENQEDIDRWNSLSDQHSGDVDAWARAIVDNKEYRVNEKNQLEYDYIIRSKDTFDIATIRNLTIDYICDLFKVNNITRTTLVQGSTDRSVYFVGYYENLAYKQVMFSYRYFECKVIYNVKFKENRIRITLTIPNFQYHLGENIIDWSLFTLYPFRDDTPGTTESDLCCRCLINTIAKTITHPKVYMDYLNEHYVSASSEEDW